MEEPITSRSDLVVDATLTIDGSQLRYSASRSSGPGGQNVNKVNSKVTLKWSPDRCEALDEAWRRRFINAYGTRINRDGDLVLQCDEHRDWSKNLSAIRERLGDMLMAVRHPPKKRKKTRPTLGSKRRRLEAKRQQSQKKRDRGTSW